MAFGRRIGFGQNMRGVNPSAAAAAKTAAPTQRKMITAAAPAQAPAQKPVSNREKAMNFLNTLRTTKGMSGIDRARALKAGMAKGGVVMANCGASVKPSQKGKK